MIQRARAIALARAREALRFPPSSVILTSHWGGLVTLQSSCIRMVHRDRVPELVSLWGLSIPEYGDRLPDYNPLAPHTWTIERTPGGGEPTALSGPLTYEEARDQWEALVRSFHSRPGACAILREDQVWRRLIVSLLPEPAPTRSSARRFSSPAQEVLHV